MVTQEESKINVVGQIEKVEPKKKSTFLDKFFKFLMYGGWLLLIIVVLAIIIAISVLTGGK